MYFVLSSTHSSRLCLTQALIKQDNLDAFNEKDPYKADDAREDEDDNDDNDNSLEAETFPLERDEVMPPPIPHPPAERVSFPRGLPWAPKVRCCTPIHNQLGLSSFNIGPISAKRPTSDYIGRHPIKTFAFLRL